MVSVNLRSIASNVRAVFPKGVKAAEIVVQSEEKLVRNPVVDKYIKQTASDLGVKLTNTTDKKILTSKMFDTLEGLFISKKAGLKLPKEIKFKNMELDGAYHLWTPKKIYLNPKIENYAAHKQANMSTSLSSAAIHEITHANDLGFKLTGTIPFLNIPLRLPGFFATGFNSLKITKNLNRLASLDREEFIACTAEKLLFESKKWSDFDPKIKKLYDLLKGPNLNLN